MCARLRACRLRSRRAREDATRRGCNGRAAGSGVEAAAGRDRGLSYRLDKNSLFCADGVNGGFLLLTDLSPLRAKIRRFLVGIKKILFSPNPYDTSPRLASSAVQGGFAQQLGARRFIAKARQRGCNGRAVGSGVEAAAGRGRRLSYRLDKNSLFCADGVNGGFLLLTDLSPLRAKIRRFLVGIKKILFSPNPYDTSPRLASSAVQGGFAQQLGARRFVAKARQRGCNGEDAAARAALQDKVARPVRPPQDLPSSDPLSLWQCLLPSRPPKPQEGRFCLRACCV